jgi:hypothetical protein
MTSTNGQGHTKETDTRVTEWRRCVDGPWYPSHPDGGIVAYRVWQQFDGLRWYQRHEWRHADGSSHLEEWINGVAGWCIDAHPISKTA